MNLYRKLRLFAGRRLPGPLKIAALAAMHAGGRRVIGVFLDPVLGCNLRCRMCYFSDPDKRKEMHGIISPDRLRQVEDALYSRALKVQIGCGAEPTLYKGLRDIVEGARRHGVPEISLVTNGQLIGSGHTDLMELADAGLGELILSLHGTRRETYEHLMQGARWDLFTATVAKIAEVRRSHPDFRLRVNFTVNSLNVDDLAGNNFWDLWKDGATPDAVQLRPVQKIGNSDWTDFDLTPLKEKFDSTIGAVAAECRRRGIVCIAPDRTQLDTVDDSQDAATSILEDIAYCYVSPDACYKPDFNPATDTYAAYHRRHHTTRRLLAAVFTGKGARRKNTSKKLNYNVK